jgi:O-antigen/teichoic acid export membrane protein
VSLGNYGAITLSFALNVILTRTLGAEQFGRLALLIMAAQLLGCFISNWTLIGLVRFSAQEFARVGTVRESFWARVVVIAPWLLGAAIVLAIGQEEAAAYFDISKPAVWLVFGYFVLSSLLLTLGSVFQALQQMDSYAITLFMDKALSIIGVLLLLASHAADPVLVVGCYAVSCLLVSSWAMTKLGPMLLPIRMNREVISSLWTFSVPMIASTWIGIVGTQWIMYVIIKYYLPFSDLGLYSLASQIAGVVQQITIISSSLLLPHFSVMVANQQEAEIKALIERVTPYWFLGFSLALGVCSLLAGAAVPLIFGADFSGAVQPFLLLMMATMSLAFFNTFMPLVSAYGSTWVLTWITFGSAVANLAAALLFVPRYGITGAALATVLGCMTAAVMMLWVIQTRLRVATLHFATLSAPVLIVVLSAQWLHGIVFYAAGLGGLIVSTLVLIAAIGLFTKEDLAILASLDMPLGIKSGLSKVFSTRTT